MAYIKNTWVDREGVTRYFETVDEDGALILTPDYAQVTEIGTPVNADNMNHIEEGIVDHEERITILEDSQDTSQYLNKFQITNCILEAPQRIKLELNNGTLTLKAGSIVIVPNGFEEDGVTPKFDYVMVENDSTFRNGANQQEIILFKDGNIVGGVPSAWTYSGVTQPTVSTTFAIWYDTANNKIKLTINNGSTWEDNLSLPIALSSSNTVQYVSIDQVFNGIGYIGNTVWVEKGVKYLSANGRNTDGTLKNIETVLSEDVSVTLDTSATSDRYLIGDSAGSILFWWSGALFDQEEEPDVTTATQYSPCLWYRPSTNIWYILPMNSTAPYNWTPTEHPCCVLAYIGRNGTTSIQTVERGLPFRAMDYNNISSNKVGFPNYKARVYKTVTATHTATQDGWVVLYVETDDHRAKTLYIDDINLSGFTYISVGGRIGIIFGMCPIKKGQVYRTKGDTSSATNATLTFIPSF